MATADTEQVTLGQLAEQAAHAIRALNHRTRPDAGALADPLDTAEIIAALAATAGMLPQLLRQLARRLQHEQHNNRLRVDALAPLPDPAQTMHTLTDSLHHAIHCIQRAAEQLDTAHQHAAHLAGAEPDTNDQDQSPPARGPNQCRSVRPTQPLSDHTR